MYGWANKPMKNSGANIQELKETKRCDLNNWDFFFPSCICPFKYKLISVNSLLFTNNNGLKIAKILKTAESVRYWTEFCQTKQTKTGVQDSGVNRHRTMDLEAQNRVREWESRFINVITSFPNWITTESSNFEEPFDVKQKIFKVVRMTMEGRTYLSIFKHTADPRTSEGKHKFSSVYVKNEQCFHQHSLRISQGFKENTSFSMYTFFQMWWVEKYFEVIW